MGTRSIVSTNEPQISPDDEPVPVKVVFASMVGVWLCYFLLITLRGAIVGLEFQDELLWRRALVCLIGVGVTALLWLCLRVVEQRSLGIKIAVALIATWVLLRTRIGNWIFASGGDANAARNSGVPVRTVKLGLFMFTAMCAALVAILTVLDTGSTDRTVALARATGARVVEGAWHDDFGRSRNEVLDHCVGRWAVVVDADEVLFVHDVAGLRRTLRRSRADALQVTVDSYRDDVGTVGMSHQSLRVLRRRRVRYEGRLHEEVRPVRPDASLQVERTALVTMSIPVIR